MSLISLIIALLSERYLTNKWWQFDTYYKAYSKLALKDDAIATTAKSAIIMLLVLLVPTMLCYYLLKQLDYGFLYLVASTVVLIICFGCCDTRLVYKRYLVAAFRGETTTCDLIHTELLQNKQLPQMGFGQALVWLNYRYFIAVMLFFVLFGAPGALFYRLLTSINERCIVKHSNEQQEQNPNQEQQTCYSSQLLFLIDWIPVRIIALGYMLVGHFSKAVSVWLENLFELNMPSYQVLISVAQQSEDIMLDPQDCTAEPCSLVRLAKRTLLLFLAFISILILTGVL